MVKVLFMSISLILTTNNYENMYVFNIITEANLSE